MTGSDGERGETRKGYERHLAGRAADVIEGEATIVSIAGTEIGLFRIGEEIYAIRNYCPHRGAPVCRGRVVGTMLPSEPGEFNYDPEKRVLSCPWHHWQYDITTGKSMFDMDKRRLVTYEVETYDVQQAEGDVFVWIRSRPRATAAASPAATRS